MSTTTPRAELGTASAILRPVCSRRPRCRARRSAARRRCRRRAARSPRQSALHQASPPRCPSRRRRLTVVPSSPGSTATVSISVRMSSRPPAVVVLALAPPAAVVADRHLDLGPVAPPRDLEAGAVRGARVLDRVRRGLAAGRRDLGDLEVVRTSVAQPAAQHAADRRERLRLRRELGAEPLGDREVAEREERHVVRPRRRRAPASSSRWSSSRAGPRARRARARRAARGRRRGARPAARPGRRCRGAASRPAPSARSPPRRSGTAALRAAPTPRPAGSAPRRPAITERRRVPGVHPADRARGGIDDDVQHRRHLALLGLGPQSSRFRRSTTRPASWPSSAYARSALRRPADHRRAGQPLAGHVAHHEPDRAAGDRDHVVPVAAHLGLGGGGR